MLDSEGQVVGQPAAAVLFIVLFLLELDVIYSSGLPAVL